MDRLRNPYTPNAGAQPTTLVGRNPQLDSFDLLLGRLKRGRTEQSMIIKGLRGVGKTVLLGKFREKAVATDWVVLEMEVQKHEDNEFRRTIAGKARTALLELSPRARWTDRAKRAAGVLKSFSVSVDPSGTIQFGMDVDRIEGLGDHGDLSLDLTDLLLSVGDAAQSVERGVVLLLDEVQFLSKQQLEALIAALHKTVQRSYPITLVGAGLPQIAELAGDAKSYAERLFQFPTIGNLDDADAREALAGPARIEGAIFEDQALDLAMEMTGRYPYFLQELGYAAWDIAEGNAITRVDVENAHEVYISKLDESFFRVRFDRCTERQKQYLRAMAELGPGKQKAQDVAAMLGKQSTQVAPFRSELVNMGLLYTPDHGYADFTVPHFDQYMKRVMPDVVQM
ncbi:ATPase [Mycobacterium sp. 1245499.0]|uniref:ATP-binding protein n=1 Tax=Mycobacterium sp. 1245499.0 TaxID=1834074 RepID=UPI0007FF9684|nr:ATP-binding protein [Mycobacterium sp. 1245499.0]OBL12795.1 ATPase [Mycobacterium sp. 1245499.0]